VNSRPQVHLIVAGEYHDFDFVRLALLQMLAERPEVRTICTNDFHGIGTLSSGDFLLTYTNNVIPEGGDLEALRSFIENGGRWLAIHGSAALTRFKPPPVTIGSIQLPGLTDTPDLAPDYMSLLGCRFISHLAQQPITVKRTQASHPVVAGVEPFEVTDEPYILELRGDCEVLLESRYTGEAPGYVLGPWLDDLPRPQLLSHRMGRGEVLYLAPGHACGRFDLQPFIQEVPVQPGPWTNSEYRKVISNAIGWGTSRG
jgi:hypothetical protein